MKSSFTFPLAACILVALSGCQHDDTPRAATADSHKATGNVARTKADGAPRTSYLNDIRFDDNRGHAGTGFITDSSDSGPNGIIVVDLATGNAFRRLNDHPSTKADQNFAPTVEGEPLMARPPGKPAAYLKMGSDGIAISADKKQLFYCPLASRRLYSVSVDALADHS